MNSNSDSNRENRPAHPRIAIIGAGLSGLAAAYHLVSSNFPGEITIFESSFCAGGLIQTYKIENFILEVGPDAFLTEKPVLLELCRKLGMGDEIIATSNQFRRAFVAYQNKLHPLPSGFSLMAPTDMNAFFKSDLFSIKGKLRAAMEPFIPPAAPEQDESVAGFVRRRFGQEIYERAAQPLISGIYTGDLEKLSMKAVLPRFFNMEQQYGSILNGLATEAHNKQQNNTKENTKENTRNNAGDSTGERGPDTGARYGLFASLKNGMGSLITKLVASLPAGCLQLNNEVTAIIKSPRNNHTWRLLLASGQHYDAEAIIIALPAHKVRRLLKQTAPVLCEKISGLEYASSAVLNLIYNRNDIPHALDGFGFVVPRSERKSILACSFSHVKFPNRAPEGKALLRVFLGGSQDPEIVQYNDEQMQSVVWNELHSYLGICPTPVLCLVTRYIDAMPQYNIGHIEKVSKIQQCLEDLPGITMASNSFHGVGMPDTALSGIQAAQKVSRYLEHLLPSTQPI